MVYREPDAPNNPFVCSKRNAPPEKRPTSKGNLRQGVREDEYIFSHLQKPMATRSCAKGKKTTEGGKIVDFSKGSYGVFDQQRTREKAHSKRTSNQTTHEMAKIHGRQKGESLARQGLADPRPSWGTHKEDAKSEKKEPKHFLSGPKKKATKKGCRGEPHLWEIVGWWKKGLKVNEEGNQSPGKG